MDQLMTIVKSLWELLVKVEIWKSGMEKKGLLVNIEKMKILMSGMNPDLQSEEVWKRPICHLSYRNRYKCFLLLIKSTVKPV